MKTTDFLIVGSGIAGLSYALKIAREFTDMKVTIITKTNRDETNTKYAQGGIAVVWDPEQDSFEQHVQDTLIAGDGLCNPDVVDFVVREAPDRIREVIAYGAQFDQTDEGEYHLGKEGGHSANRILHHKDITGWEIERTLLDQVAQMPNIELITHHFVIDIITQHHLGYIVNRVTPNVECYGLYVLDLQTHRIEKVLARITVLATGGAGQVYKSTTNPTIATGDGIAMVYRANGRIENMEFVQFHPTALYLPDENPSFLISEAVRGEGAVLRNPITGEEFMHKYDERGSLAPRDIVARAIDNELKTLGVDFVHLDAGRIDADDFAAHFPNIREKCLEIGIDTSSDFIPVVPAAHYLCGGIQVDSNSRTSIHRLYAVGECSSTGLHGANRLASNSLLEALVFAHRAFEHSKERISEYEIRNDIPDWDATGTSDPQEMVLITQSIRELKEIMSAYVGIVRNDVRLKRALDRLYLLYRETEELYDSTTISPQLMELRNMITNAYLISRSASIRPESRGLHFNLDHPEKFRDIQATLL